MCPSAAQIPSPCAMTVAAVLRARFLFSACGCTARTGSCSTSWSGRKRGPKHARRRLPTATADTRLEADRRRGNNRRRCEDVVNPDALDISTCVSRHHEKNGCKTPSQYPSSWVFANIEGNIHPQMAQMCYLRLLSTMRFGVVRVYMRAHTDWCVQASPRCFGPPRFLGRLSAT